MSGIWGPFPIDNVLIGLDNEAILLVASTKLLQSTFGLIDSLDPLLSVRVTASQGIFERGKPRVELNDACGIVSKAVNWISWGPLPVPSAATLSPAGSERIEFSDALFNAEVAMMAGPSPTVSIDRQSNDIQALLDAPE